MLDYIRIACGVPAVRVGDTKKNAADICDFLMKADAQNVDQLFFSETAQLRDEFEALYAILFKRPENYLR